MATDPRLPTPPTPPKSRRLSARAALACIGLAVLLLVLFEGRSIRHAGQEMQPGWERSFVLAVGRPAGWLADQLPLQNISNHLTAWLRPSSEVSRTGPGGFSQAANTAASGAAVPPVTADAFDPASIGVKSVPPRPLHTVLVTGDSMSMPLDAELARRLAGTKGVKTIRDPHLGTGISQSDIVDWGALAVQQVRQDHPDAVVMFLGANEGFPMRIAGRDVQCCGTAWTVEYAYRVRRLMNTFRQGGVARVYWLTLPWPRSSDRQDVARVVNAAIGVAAQPYRAQVRVLDMGSIFTPGDRYRDSMPVGGQDTIVRQSDGVHLNEAGAGVAAGAVLAAMRADWPSAVPG
jgi:hypothetical protein